MAPKRTTPRTSADKSGSRSRPAKKPAKAVAPPADVAPPTPAPTPPPASIRAPTPPPALPPVAASRWTLGGTLVLILVLLAIVATVVGALWLRGDGKDFKLELGVPTAASASDLRAFASPGRPVYWVGPPNSGTLEVTRTDGGAIYVRYLPAGVDVGDSAPSYTTVGTYAQPDAYTTMQASARTPGFKKLPAANGGLVVWKSDHPTSVYLTFPNTDYLIEVFDPSPRRARTLATSRVRLVR